MTTSERSEPDKSFVRERAKLEQEWCELRQLQAQYKQSSAEQVQEPVAGVGASVHEGAGVTDIVERLREKSRLGYWPLLGDEAADEIERLRAALLRLCKSMPTDTDMRTAGFDSYEIEEACNAYDAARAALEKP